MPVIPVWIIGVAVSLFSVQPQKGLNLFNGCSGLGNHAVKPPRNILKDSADRVREGSTKEIGCVSQRIVRPVINRFKSVSHALDDIRKANVKLFLEEIVNCRQRVARHGLNGFKPSGNPGHDICQRVGNLRPEEVLYRFQRFSCPFFNIFPVRDNRSNRQANKDKRRFHGNPRGNNTTKNNRRRLKEGIINKGAEILKKFLYVFGRLLVKAIKKQLQEVHNARENHARNVAKRAGNIKERLRGVARLYFATAPRQNLV